MKSKKSALEKDGTDGVCEFLKGVGRELRYIMSSTGCAGVGDIDDSLLYRKG